MKKLFFIKNRLQFFIPLVIYSLKKFKDFDDTVLHSFSGKLIFQALMKCAIFVSRKISLK